jgi:hypothetical protein
MCPIPDGFWDRAISLYGSLDLAALPLYYTTVWSMWIGVKRQLAAMTVGSDTVGVLWKVPHIFTNVDYVNMLHVYGVVSLLLLKNMCRFPDHRVFSKVFDTFCGMLPSAHVSTEWARQQHVEEQENILEKVQCSPTTSTQRLSTRLGVSRTCVWRTLHDDGFYLFHPQRVQNLHLGDSAMCLEFCHWFHTNCK